MGALSAALAAALSAVLAASAGAPAGADLAVPADVLQLPDYPSGCEVVSLSCALAGLGDGRGVEETYDLFVKSDSDFVGAWWGSMTSVGAAYPPAVEDAAMRAGTVLADDVTGCPWEDLAAAVESDRLALVWITTDYAPPRWTDWAIGGWRMYANEHCAVLYDCEGGAVLFHDPLRGRVLMDEAQFREMWEACGSMAVVLWRD